MARIVRVDIKRHDYPLVGEFKFFRTSTRIRNIFKSNGVLAMD